MLWGKHIKQTVEEFAAQFEPKDSKFHYLKDMRGPPIIVTKEERDRFVSDYEKASGRLIWVSIWLLAFSIFVTVIVSVTLEYMLEIDIGYALIYGIIALFVAIFLSYWRRVWTAPARVLERRPVVGEARSRADVAILRARNISWWRLFLVPLLLLYPLANLDFSRSLLAGIIFYLGLLILMVALILRLILIKLKANRSG
ncbi:MAG: hypothetical protein ACFBQW_04680 [Sphingomonadaceae bacterium]